MRIAAARREPPLQNDTEESKKTQPASTLYGGSPVIETAALIADYREW
jgi:hypothetical protein